MIDVNTNESNVYKENELLKEENKRLTLENIQLKESLKKISIVVEDVNNINNTHKRAKIDNTGNITSITKKADSNTINTNTTSITKKTDSNSINTNTNINKKVNILPYVNGVTINWLLQFDGGSRGNPGLGGSGAVLYKNGIASDENEIWSGFFFLGDNVTNNFAEYTGLIEGLKYIVKVKLEGNVLIQGDSELVIKQLQGIYRVKNENLKPLHQSTLTQINSLSSTTFYCEHIRREFNARADKLSNDALDNRCSNSKEI